MQRFKTLDGFLHVWYYVVNSVRNKLKEQYKDKTSKALKVAKERLFTALIFPLKYKLTDSQNQYDLLFPVNLIAWLNRDKNREKKHIAARLEKITGIKISNVDMGACHLKILAKHTDKTQSPEIYKAILAKNYYSELGLIVIQSKG